MGRKQTERPLDAVARGLQTFYDATSWSLSFMSEKTTSDLWMGCLMGFKHLLSHNTAKM